MSLFTDFTQIQTTAASVVLSNTTSTINQTIYAALNFTTKTSSVSCDNSISTSVPVPSTTFVIYQNIDFSFSNIFVQVSQNLIVAETVFITLLFFAGIIGNIFTIRIFREKTFMISNKFFKYLALMDLFFIIAQYITKLFLKYNLFLPYLTNFFCKFYLYNLFWLIECCSMLLVLINVSQLLTIACNIKNPQIDNSGNLGCLMRVKQIFHKNSISISILLLAILNVPNIYFANSYIFPNQLLPLCGINSSYNVVINKISIIFITIVPYFLICLMTLILGLLVLIPNTQCKAVLKQTHQYQCVITAIFLNLCYIILYFLLIYFHLKNITLGRKWDKDAFSIEILLQVDLNINTIMTFTMVFLFSSIKPIIYFSASQSYRDKLKTIFFRIKNNLRFNRYRSQENFGIDNNNETRTEVNVVYHNNNAPDEVIIMQRGLF